MWYVYSLIILIIGDVVLEEGEEVFILDRTSNKEWWKVFHQEKGECYLPSSCLFSNLE